MLRVVADDKIPFLKGVLEPFAQVTYLPGSRIDRNSIKDADALIIRTRTKCNEELLSGTPVKFIATATIGFDHIDTVWCEQNNIKWTNAPGCNSSSVQQYVASALLKISGDSGFLLRDKTLGIVGVGNVGSKVLKVAEAFGMKVLLNDPPRARREGSDGFATFEQILAEADIITIHVPLNLEGEDKTHNMFTGEVFGRIRKGAWLINTSRGEVVSTEAFKDALAGEKIDGAVIDVWEKEPEIDIALMHMAFLATPHIAGYSADGKANGTAMAVRSLSDEFRLPLTEWYPSEIPDTPEPVFTIDCNGKDAEDIARRAVFHSYNIIEDDVRLRFDPSRFEKERENYPVRREFPYYTINLRGAGEETVMLLKKLGFKVTS
ncbi:MAG TPA: 4-phosphoerythronate dehydrogenase [Bacteroidales bacterium]|jgi:erythronate-4-phosphate dehydrogenase|nr:4-phosphoerythronate dehydrogenase [Bacteroidales bacterium]